VQRGEYAFRSFRFSADGLLTSSAGDHAAAHLPPPTAGYDPGVAIDRLVVLGLPGGPARWSAAVVGADGAQQRQLEAAPGPLYNREGLPDAALVVRRAALPAGGSWSIRFSPAAGTAGSVS
jgi:hypothetical protein